MLFLYSNSLVHALILIPKLSVILHSGEQTVTTMLDLMLPTTKRIQNSFYLSWLASFQHFHERRGTWFYPWLLFCSGIISVSRWLFFTEFSKAKGSFQRKIFKISWNSLFIEIVRISSLHSNISILKHHFLTAYEAFCFDAFKSNYLTDKLVHLVLSDFYNI